MNNTGTLSLLEIDKTKEEEDIGAIYGATKEIFEEEAEQSRLMTAVSAGK